MAADGDISLRQTIGDGQLSEQTARLQAEIDEQAGLIRLITENISEAFWIADAGMTRTLYASPGYEIVMGLTLESLYDNPRSFLNAIHPEDKGRLIADMEVLKSGLPFNHDYRVVHPDGSVRWVWSRGFPDKKSGLSIYVGIVEDITERKLMEYSLIEERNKFKSIIDAMEDGLTIRDLEYNLTYQSKMTLSMFGSRLGEKCYKVFANSNTICEGCPVEMSYKDGQSHPLVKKVVIPGGEIRYFENTANPIRDAGGNVVACLEINKDITAKRMAAEALKASEEKYRNLLNDAVDAIIIADYEGFLIDLNRKAEELLGFTNEELAGRHYIELLPEHEIERSRILSHDLINDGHVSVSNLQLKHRCGSLVPADINARVIEYGGKKVIQGIFRDIRERLELQNIIEQEHSFRKAIEDSAAAGIAAVDLEGRQIYANPSFCKMVGWVPEELVGALPPYIYWAPEDLCNIDSALKTTLDGNAPQEGFDAVFRKKNGEHFNVNILISPLVDAKGVKAGWLASVYDITTRKMMENELKTKTHMLGELNENLESLVRAKVDELSRKEQLLIQQSKMAAMGEMIGAIAHQWRQPLNSLSLMIQDIKDAHEFGVVNDGYINNTVKTAMSQINFMSTTIDVFRNFFNPSKNEEKLDIIGVCSDVFSMLSSQLKVNSIAYRISCNKHNRTCLNNSKVMRCDESEIMANKNHLAHVLLNLINNAKDAILMRREDGLLTDDGMIAVDCNKDNRTLKVEISDNGGGIPEAIIDKIFDQYFTTKADKGTGIGLYMSRIIVEESLGGRLYARNTDGGSVFTIELYL
ncbi:MAG: PAS domain S-box protein [Nitrospirae bacterium]|nr:PAS domain S-box protein [Nitrospirota bacterium]